MAAFAPVSAKACKIRIGATVLIKAEWDVSGNNPPIDSTNNEGGGFHEEISSINKATANIKGLWDSGNDDFANPPNIVQGQVLSAVKLYLNDTGGPFWLFPLLRIETVHVNANVEGGVLLDFTANGTGTFSYPT